MQGDGSLAVIQMNQVKSDIENFKYLFLIEDDGGIEGKRSCIQLIAINKELSNWKTTVLFRLFLGKETLKMLVTGSDLYLETNTRDKKIPNLLFLDRGWR